MRSLKLKKVKISRVTNSHLLFGGAQQAGQAAQGPQNPETYTLDTKYDDSCLPGTNGSTSTLENATGIRGRGNFGVQN